MLPEVRPGVPFGCSSKRACSAFGHIRSGKNDYWVDKQVIPANVVFAHRIIFELYMLGSSFHLLQ